MLCGSCADKRFSTIMYVWWLALIQIYGFYQKLIVDTPGTYTGKNGLMEVFKPEGPRNYQIQTDTIIVRQHIDQLQKTGDTIVRKALNNKTDALEDDISTTWFY